MITLNINLVAALLYDFHTYPKVCDYLREIGVDNLDKMHFYDWYSYEYESYSLKFNDPNQEFLFKLKYSEYI